MEEVPSSIPGTDLFALFAPPLPLFGCLAVQCLLFCNPSVIRPMDDQAFKLQSRRSRPLLLAQKDKKCLAGRRAQKFDLTVNVVESRSRLVLRDVERTNERQ